MDNEVLNSLIVVKRSGQRVNFNSLKIAVAIKLGFDNVDNNYTEKEINKVYEDTLKYITDNYKDRKTINVEDIQDIIETILKKDKYNDIYESFSNYRIRRSESRKVFSIKRQHKFVKVIEKLDAKIINNLTPTEALKDFGRTISNEYTKSYIMDNKYVRAFEEGKIYIHNFDYLNLGFISDTHLKLTNVLNNDDCFYSLLSLLTNAKQELNGEIAIDNIDSILIKNIVNKYKLIFKDNLKKYLNLMGYFEFINYKKITELIDKKDTINYIINDFNEVIINNQINNIFLTTIHDTDNYINSYLTNFINKLLIILNNNDNKYSISFGLNKEKEGLLISQTLVNELNKLERLDNVTIIAKLNKDSNLSLINNVSNLIINNKNIKLNFKNIDYFGNGLLIHEDINDFSVTGRMIIANTSINIARLSLKYKILNKDFFDELDEILDLVKNELLFVFETIGDKCSSNYKILFKGNILDDEKLETGQKIRKVIKNGCLNINVIGLKECSDIMNNESVIKILKYLNEKVTCIKQDTKLNFTLSSINYKHASNLFIELDKTIFGLVNKITNKSSYEELNNINNLDNLKEISKYQKLLTGGNELVINLPKNTSVKKVNEIIYNLIDNEISFACIKNSSDKK